MSPLRYAAYTIDGGLIFSADSAQRLGDKVAEHLQEERKPRLGYTQDTHGGAYPFTVWKRQPGVVVGLPCASFAEVCAVWGGVQQ